MSMSTSPKRAFSIIHTMWLREMIKFWRSKSRIIGALTTPLTFMFFLGPGLMSGFQMRGGENVDISFFAPGLIGMSVLFASLFGGIAIIWEREFGVLKEILITPVSRFYVALGKAVGGVTIALIQGILIMIIAILIARSQVSIIGILASIVMMFLCGIGFCGLGIALAAKIDNHEGFQVIMSFLTMPLVLLSGAFFPIKDLPHWLSLFVYANPLTYGVEALRWSISGSSTVPLHLSLAVMILFDIVVFVIAGRLFEKMKVV